MSRAEAYSTTRHAPHALRLGLSSVSLEQLKPVLMQVRETIERFGHVRVIGEVPRLPNLHRTALMQVFLNHFDRAAFSQ